METNTTPRPDPGSLSVCGASAPQSVEVWQCSLPSDLDTNVVIKFKMTGGAIDFHDNIRFY